MPRSRPESLPKRTSLGRPPTRPTQTRVRPRPPLGPRAPRDDPEAPMRRRLEWGIPPRPRAADSSRIRRRRLEERRLRCRPAGERHQPAPRSRFATLAQDLSGRRQSGAELAIAPPTRACRACRGRTETRGRRDACDRASMRYLARISGGRTPPRRSTPRRFANAERKLTHGATRPHVSTPERVRPNSDRGWARPKRRTKEPLSPVPTTSRAATRFVASSGQP